MTHTMRAMNILLDEGAKQASIVAHAEIQRLILRIKFKYDIQIINFIMSMGAWSYGVSGLNEYNEALCDDQYDFEELATPFEDESLGGLIGMFVELLEFITNHPDMDVIS